MLVLFIIVVIILTILLEKIYHRLFHVVYFSFGSIVKEFGTLFLISFCIVSLIFSKLGLFE
ncbi:MAG: hypothetical protein ACI4RG_06800 [Huintestinicola sp.]